MPKAAATQPGLVDRIAHDIQSGVYGAGAWLKQIDLQERYDCTRLEVRRALDQLTAKRLIAHIPNRAITCTPWIRTCTGRSATSASCSRPARRPT